MELILRKEKPKLVYRLFTFLSNILKKMSCYFSSVQFFGTNSAKFSVAKPGDNNARTESGGGQNRYHNDNSFAVIVPGIGNACPRGGKGGDTDRGGNKEAENDCDNAAGFLVHGCFPFRERHWDFVPREKFAMNGSYVTNFNTIRSFLQIRAIHCGIIVATS